ncbi:MAG: PspC domain-containing protein [Pseudonocardiales bacterium]|nr:PspC domain-containing protein [Pseudonocardiales bacterium]
MTVPGDPVPAPTLPDPPPVLPPAGPPPGPPGARPLARARLPLRRSRRDRVFGGVCGGIARHLDVDPVLLRVAAVALALSGGVGVLAYLVAWVVLPEADEDEPETAAPPAGRHAVAIAVGAALVGLGVLLLVRQWLPWFGAEVFWPLVVVAVGALVLVTARR